MKKLFTIIFIVGTIISTCAQSNYIRICEACGHTFSQFNFNSADDSTKFYIQLDSAQSNNLWQLGKPSKTIFNSGYPGSQKAFLTDTINTYPKNNISSFQFAVKNCSSSTQAMGCGGYWGLFIHFAVKINSDSTHDGGTIEVSHNGSAWVNLITDSLATIHGDIYSIADTISSMGKPGFSGVANTWKYFDLSYNQAQQSSFDTITFKFTFTSDSIETHKDGWMIGYIDLMGGFEAIEEINNHKSVTLSPNPFTQSTRISLDRTYGSVALEVFNLQGQMVCRQDYQDCNELVLQRNQLSQGLYFLKLTLDGKMVETGKIVVE